jgi:hypothetical protein
MGFAVAAAAREAGHRVTLVAGPVHLETPAGVKRIDVVSAREMLVACVEVFAEADAVIMTAAVADYRSRRRLAGKWRDKGSARIELVPNPDILAKLGRSKAADRGKKSTRTVIGFASRPAPAVPARWPSCTPSAPTGSCSTTRAHSTPSAPAPRSSRPTARACASSGAPSARSRGR